MSLKSSKEDNGKIPLGPAAGETVLYALMLAVFLICGVWFPHRNFHLISSRIGQAGDLPKGSLNAIEFTDALFRWQGFLIVLFAALVFYFWWTSTWTPSTAKKSVRFLLWCVPAGFYLLMFWIIYWLMFPLKLLTDVTTK